MNDNPIKVSDGDAAEVRALEGARALTCSRCVILDLEIAKLTAAKVKALAEVVEASKRIAGIIERFRARYDVPAGSEYDYVAGASPAPKAPEPTTSEGG